MLASSAPPGTTILITTNHLRNLGGSELVAWEIAELFLDSGCAVDLYSLDMGGDMLALIAAREQDPLLRLLPLGSDQEFRDDYDIMWVQHGVLPAEIIAKLESTGSTARMVWHHMSTFHDLEMPRLVDVEAALASLSTGMCGRAVERLAQMGLPSSSLALFDNPAPDEFAASPPRVSPLLRTILVVSNHPPAEVIDAAKILKSRGVETSFVGAQSSATRISASDLESYDAVLTIGKTVQFALSAGIPVYVYDHFGGPGWLTDGNFDSEHDWAFSGRASGRHLGSEAIAEEVISGFSDASNFVRARHDEFARRWRLSTSIAELLDDPRMRPREQPIRLSSQRASQYRSLMGLQNLLSEASLHQLRSDYRVELQREALYMTGSVSWKITKPLRAIANAGLGCEDVNTTVILRASALELERIVSELAESHSWKTTRFIRRGRVASSHQRWLARAQSGFSGSARL